MKIIPLINEITDTFNKIFGKNLNPLNLESKIRDAGDTFFYLVQIYGLFFVCTLKRTLLINKKRI